MTRHDEDLQRAESAWLGIGLDVYERHMGDDRVGQLQQLRAITAEQLADHAPRSVAVVGVAGGNGLDLIDPDRIDAVHGYDVNAEYLQACEARHRAVLGDRLHLVRARIDASTVIAPVELLIANLVVEYIGVEEFAAFVALNRDAIAVVSCVVQCSTAQGFVSSSDDAAAFAGLAAESADVDPDVLHAAMSRCGFTASSRREHVLPNGKTLVRQDFRARAQ